VVAKGHASLKIPRWDKACLDPAVTLGTSRRLVSIEAIMSIHPLQQTAGAANCGSADVSLKKRVHVGGWVIMEVSLFMGLVFIILGFFTCFTFFRPRSASLGCSG
jgi:hypothetical protein